MDGVRRVCLRMKWRSAWNVFNMHANICTPELVLHADGAGYRSSALGFPPGSISDVSSIIALYAFAARQSGYLVYKRRLSSCI